MTEWGKEEDARERDVDIGDVYMTSTSASGDSQILLDLEREAGTRVLSTVVTPATASSRSAGIIDEGQTAQQSSLLEAYSAET